MSRVSDTADALAAVYTLASADARAEDAAGYKVLLEMWAACEAQRLTDAYLNGEVTARPRTDGALPQHLLAALAEEERGKAT